MSASLVLRALKPVLDRVDSITTDADGLNLLNEGVTVLARHMAEIVFAKVHGDPDWTPQAVQDLIDSTYHRLSRNFTETVHAHGGTLEMALDLGDVLVMAYVGRLRELRVGSSVGGAA